MIDVETSESARKTPLFLMPDLFCHDGMLCQSFASFPLSTYRFFLTEKQLKSARCQHLKDSMKAAVRTPAAF